MMSLTELQELPQSVNFQKLQHKTCTDTPAQSLTHYGVTIHLQRRTWWMIPTGRVTPGSRSRCQMVLRWVLMFLYVRFEVHQIIRFYLMQVNRKLQVNHCFLTTLCFGNFLSVLFSIMFCGNLFSLWLLHYFLLPSSQPLKKPRLQKRLPIRIWELVEFHPSSCFILKCTSCVLVWCACGIDGAAAAWWRLRGSSRMWCLDKDTAQSRTTC